MLLPAAVVLVLVSSQTGFNHHMRYILPIFPFVFVATGKLAYFFRSDRPWTRLAILALLGWAVFSSLRVYPHSMSYFNELAGGPENGHNYLVDSNIDWGQDLLELRDWVPATYRGPAVRAGVLPLPGPAAHRDRLPASAARLGGRIGAGCGGERFRAP